ncbi:MAG: hypothetical protein FJZ92_01970 [Chloroflexi bacterium]|nr:hypothetical protein [Chloroflexota bacterium]
MTPKPRLPSPYVPEPLRQGREVHCPRCGGRLLRDVWNLLCIACGYEYAVTRYLVDERTRREATHGGERVGAR